MSSEKRFRLAPVFYRIGRGTPLPLRWRQVPARVEGGVLPTNRRSACARRWFSPRTVCAGSNPLILLGFHPPVRAGGRFHRPQLRSVPIDQKRPHLGHLVDLLFGAGERCSRCDSRTRRRSFARRVSGATSPLRCRLRVPFRCIGRRGQGA